jgi:hypothetical protein
MGFKTFSNDFLNFNNQIGLALIENKEFKLTKEDLKLFFQPATNKTDFELMENAFTNVFFEKDEAEFLDNFRANIPLLDNTFKQAIAYTVINRSMTRKITMGHFGPTQALVHASDPERIKRNRSLVRPIKEIFEELLPSTTMLFLTTKKKTAVSTKIF